MYTKQHIMAYYIVGQISLCTNCGHEMRMTNGTIRVKAEGNQVGEGSVLTLDELKTRYKRHMPRCKPEEEMPRAPQQIAWTRNEVPCCYLCFQSPSQEIGEEGNSTRLPTFKEEVYGSRESENLQQFERRPRKSKRAKPRNLPLTLEDFL